MAQRKARKGQGARSQPSRRDSQPARSGESAAAPPIPIVGIGASAGGLAAFEAFFSGMPAAAEPGMAFVLVQHLAPDHKSILSELIRRYTRMQVFEVEDGMPVQRNCAYIIPPNRDMAFANHRLQLLEPAAPRGRRLPIDYFFRSLAEDQHERAIGIILAGTGSDGTLGARAIKGEGGMIMAQDPASTEFSGMPVSAIATGLVDYQLAPAQMPAQLIAYVAHAFGKTRLALPDAKTPSENTLRKLFVLLRSHTSHDFSQYKPSTVNRRIARRMAVHQIETLEQYVKFMQQTPLEIEAMFRDLLIGVTNFFRDPEAFAALQERVIPKLFAGRPGGATIRVWSAGCSTGEEVYSIAIQLREHMDLLPHSYRVQIFATDIDAQAIATARIGLYPASIAADISPDRLARFFTVEPGGNAYRIHKSIRDMLVFSTQDLVKDPPFSKLDLLVCRNLLIYLSGDLQKRLIPLFHYALEPGGVLFLGNSETVGDFDDLFVPLDRKAKLYGRGRKHGFHVVPRAALAGTFVQKPIRGAGIASGKDTKIAVSKPPFRDLAEKALLQAIPAAALVDDTGNIFYLHGRTGRYLELPPGETGVNNLVKMAREGLSLPLSAALRRAATEKLRVRCAQLDVKTNGEFTPVDLTITPLPAGAAFDRDLYLVVLQDAPMADSPRAPALTAEALDPAARSDTDRDLRILALQEELRAKDDALQSLNEEMESSNEELKSSNEEMQSINEELQSTNEELETSREELQSINEELAVVNAELQTKVADLSRANNDMNNLLAGTGIGTVFVDHSLCILRFTPAATQIINLIASDIGRPVAHIVSNLLDYDGIVADTKSVLDTLIPKEVEVQTHAHEWYSMRILPYRTLENIIEGAVIAFVNITAAKQARDILGRSALGIDSSRKDR